MGTKIEPGEFDCYAAALPDEPMFILLGRDESAPKMLRHWADIRRKDLSHQSVNNPELLDDEQWSERQTEDLKKCTQADLLAFEMERWRKQNDGVWRKEAVPRFTLGEIDPGMKQSIAEAMQSAIAQYLFCGDAQFSMAEHNSTAWSMPGFAVRRHFFRFESSEPTFERFKDNLHPDFKAWEVSGFDLALGNVVVLYKSDTRISVIIDVVELPS